MSGTTIPGGVMTRVSEGIVSVVSAKFVGSALSVARTLNVYKPGILGGPASAQQFGPQISCTVIPGGGLPAVTDQAYIELTKLVAKRNSKVKRPAEVSKR